jgi:single-strand DNA-binding protein
MSSVNKVMLVGRLGQDPETKYLTGGTCVCNFSIATSDVWVDNNGHKQEKTEWHRIVVYGKAAENCGKHLRKGGLIHVEGKIEYRTWKDKDDRTCYMTEIKAQQVKFLSKAKERSQDSTGDAPEDTMEEQAS